jgi:4-hydroxy-tetrahydrodipicolinate synthase
LMEANFWEPNPGPVKFIMSRMGLLEPSYRLPMVPPEAAIQKRLDGVVESLRLSETVRASAV